MAEIISYSEYQRRKKEEESRKYEQQRKTQSERREALREREVLEAVARANKKAGVKVNVGTEQERNPIYSDYSIKGKQITPQKNNLEVKRVFQVEDKKTGLITKKVTQVGKYVQGRNEKGYYRYFQPTKQFIQSSDEPKKVIRDIARRKLSPEYVEALKRINKPEQYKKEKIGETIRKPSVKSFELFESIKQIPQKPKKTIEKPKLQKIKGESGLQYLKRTIKEREPYREQQIKIREERFKSYFEPKEKRMSEFLDVTLDRLKVSRDSFKGKTVRALVRNFGGIPADIQYLAFKTINYLDKISVPDSLARKTLLNTYEYIKTGELGYDVIQSFNPNTPQGMANLITLGIDLGLTKGLSKKTKTINSKIVKNNPKIKIVKKKLKFSKQIKNNLKQGSIQSIKRDIKLGVKGFKKSKIYRKTGYIYRNIKKPTIKTFKNQNILKKTKKNIKIIKKKIKILKPKIKKYSGNIKIIGKKGSLKFTGTRRTELGRIKGAEKGKRLKRTEKKPISKALKSKRSRGQYIQPTKQQVSIIKQIKKDISKKQNLQPRIRKKQPKQTDIIFTKKLERKFFKNLKDKKLGFKNIVQKNIQKQIKKTISQGSVSTRNKGLILLNKRIKSKIKYQKLSIKSAKRFAEKEFKKPTFNNQYKQIDYVNNQLTKKYNNLNKNTINKIINKYKETYTPKQFINRIEKSGGRGKEISKTLYKLQQKAKERQKYLPVKKEYRTSNIPVSSDILKRYKITYENEFNRGLRGISGDFTKIGINLGNIKFNFNTIYNKINKIKKNTIKILSKDLSKTQRIMFLSKLGRINKISQEVSQIQIQAQKQTKIQKQLSQQQLRQIQEYKLQQNRLNRKLKKLIKKKIPFLKYRSKQIKKYIEEVRKKQLKPIKIKIIRKPTPKKRKYFAYIPKLKPKLQKRIIRKYISNGKIKSKYVPTLLAIYYNIKGKKPKRITGLEERVIVSFIKRKRLLSYIKRKKMILKRLRAKK